MRKKHQTFRTLALTLAGVLCICTALMAVPALADNAAGVVKPFAKHGIPGAQIVFSAADFQTNQIGGGKLAGILITACPEAAEGTFQIDGANLEAGSFVPLKQMDELCFVPAEETAMSVQLDFEPIFAVKNGQLAGEASSVVVSLDTTRNYAPSAANLTLSTYRNVPVQVHLSAYDHEGDLLTYTVVSAPGKGTLTASQDGLIYTPQSGKTGTVSFQYYAADEAGNTSDLATVTIRVEKQKQEVCYADLTDPAQQHDAVYLAEKGVYLGRTIGKDRVFEADETLTRGEFIAMASAALSLDLNSPVGPVLTESCGWQGAYLAAALDSGVIHTVRYQEDITTAEATSIVSRLIRADVPTAGLLDISPAWAAQDVSALYALGILTKTSAMQETLTRGEAAAILARARAVTEGERLGWAVYGG